MQRGLRVVPYYVTTIRVTRPRRDQHDGSTDPADELGTTRGRRRQLDTTTARIHPAVGEGGTAATVT